MNRPKEGEAHEAGTLGGCACRCNETGVPRQCLWEAAPVGGTKPEYLGSACGRAAPVGGTKWTKKKKKKEKMKTREGWGAEVLYENLLSERGPYVNKSINII